MPLLEPTQLSSISPNSFSCGTITLESTYLVEETMIWVGKSKKGDKRETLQNLLTMQKNAQMPRAYNAFYTCRSQASGNNLFIKYQFQKCCFLLLLPYPFHDGFNPLTPKVINKKLLPIISLHYPANRWWEYSNSSVRSCYLDLTPNSHY